MSFKLLSINFDKEGPIIGIIGPLFSREVYKNCDHDHLS
jgi:hypothetical protein